MKNSHINKLGMFFVVISALDKWADLISKTPALVRLVAAFKQLVSDIGEKSEEVGQGTSGETKAKKKADDDMTSDVTTLVGGLHAYAADIDDQDLMQKSDISESDIQRKRDAERADYAKSLVDLVDGHKDDLADWGVTDVEIAATRQSVKAFKDTLGKRSTTKTGHEGSRETIESMFARGDRMLTEQIDNLVKKFRKTNPDFFAEYEAARVIKDIAATRPKPPNPPPQDGDKGKS